MKEREGEGGRGCMNEDGKSIYLGRHEKQASLMEEWAKTSGAKYY